MRALEKFPERVEGEPFDESSEERQVERKIFVMHCPVCGEQVSRDESSIFQSAEILCPNGHAFRYKPSAEDPHQ